MNQNWIFESHKHFEKVGLSKVTLLIFFEFEQEQRLLTLFKDISAPGEDGPGECRGDITGLDCVLTKQYKRY